MRQILKTLYLVKGIRHHGEQLYSTQSIPLCLPEQKSETVLVGPLSVKVPTLIRASLIWKWEEKLRVNRTRLQFIHCIETRNPNIIRDRNNITNSVRRTRTFYCAMMKVWNSVFITLKFWKHLKNFCLSVQRDSTMGSWPGFDSWHFIQSLEHHQM